MSNALNKNIQKFEVVVVRRGVLLPKFEADRRFVCMGGFGMSSFTSGAKIFGFWLADGERDHVRGEWLSKDESASARIGPEDRRAILMAFVNHYFDLLAFRPQDSLIDEWVGRTDSELADEIEWTIEALEAMNAETSPIHVVDPKEALMRSFEWACKAVAEGWPIFGRTVVELTLMSDAKIYAQAQWDKIVEQDSQRGREEQAEIRDQRSVGYPG